ncbi:MAG: hypothetical protein RLZZ117_574 [Cyanobacteriota bacterium]|jgi:hypothetical protein
MIGRKFIFIHIPRTGGTSLERILLSLEGIANWDELASKKVVDQCVGAEKHFRASRVQALVGAQHWQKALKLSIVRNPFDKVISHYFQPYYRAINALSGHSLDFFLDAYAPAPHEDGKTCNDYLDREMDVIIRYENYDHELLSILEPFGVKPSQLRTRIGAVRERTGYQGYYSRHAKQIVENLYKEDLERFNYVF